MLDSQSLITHNNPKSPISEAYRVLRTNIQYSSFDKPLQAIAVTSSGPGEGKTTTVANLAVSFAQQGSRVLLIDADLRKPKLHKLFGIEKQKGLTNLISIHDDYKNYLNKGPMENMDILICGAIPPNPSELLMSNSMKQFIQQIREDYELIFLDSPPVGTVTDAAILSTIVDGTILVAASGDIEIDAMIRVKELLNRVNANIIGVVLNKAAKSHGSKYYYYYYYADSASEAVPKRRKHKKNIQPAENPYQQLYGREESTQCL